MTVFDIQLTEDGQFTLNVGSVILVGFETCLASIRREALGPVKA